MHVFRTSVIPLLMERIRRENNLLIIYIKYDNKSFHGWLNVIWINWLLIYEFSLNMAIDKVKF